MCSEKRMLSPGKIPGGKEAVWCYGGQEGSHQLVKDILRKEKKMCKGCMHLMVPVVNCMEFVHARFMHVTQYMYTKYLSRRRDHAFLMAQPFHTMPEI